MTIDLYMIHHQINSLTKW